LGIPPYRQMIIYHIFYIMSNNIIKIPDGLFPSGIFNDLFRLNDLTTAHIWTQYFRNDNTAVRLLIIF